jgi:predicted dienelactone hydrolase
MRFALPILFLTAAAALAAPDPTYVKIAGRDVAVWKPSVTASPAGYPLILFSHGFTGCATQSVFLMEALAQAGYLVMAPNHKDAACSAWGKGRSEGKLLTIRPEESFRKDREWSAATYKDRADDPEAILDALSHGSAVPGAAADMSRVALAGHSLGGYTVLGLAGAWPSWKDPRIKAVLALSPFCSPYELKGALRQMNVPVMYQGGTADLGITPTVKRLNGAYARSSAPKYFVEFQGAGHFAWTNVNPTFQDLIDRYSVAFFDRYLKGQQSPDPLAPLLAKPLPRRVSETRADSN